MPLIFAPAASEACCRHVQFCLSIRRMLSASETLPFITAMKKKPKIVSIREDENGQLYGLRWNPDERIEISNDDLNSLHKVVAIYL